MDVPEEETAYGKSKDGIEDAWDIQGTASDSGNSAWLKHGV